MGDNVAEDKMTHHQEGGTAMVARGRLLGMVMETAKGKRNLERWCWMKIGTPERPTYVATGYISCDDINNSSAGERVIY